MGFYQKKTSQLVNASLDDVWDFISSPANLKEITPDHMGFDITSKDIPEKMYPGMIISYIVRPMLNIPTTWVTEITHVVEKEFFVDEQRIGPYSMWHHEHRLTPQGDKTLMEDIISYQPPFGFLGNIANALFIKKQLNTIFDYREKAVKKRFPGS